MHHTTVLKILTCLCFSPPPSCRYITQYGLKNDFDVGYMLNAPNLAESLFAKFRDDKRVKNVDVNIASRSCMDERLYSLQWFHMTLVIIYAWCVPVER